MMMSTRRHDNKFMNNIVMNKCSACKHLPFSDMMTVVWLFVITLCTCAVVFFYVAGKEWVRCLRDIPLDSAVSNISQ